MNQKSDDTNHIIDVDPDDDAVMDDADMNKGPMDDTRSKPLPEKPGGGGVVWVLAIVLVVGLGAYAAWPYVGHKVEPYVGPYVQQAKSLLGLNKRPSEPTLPTDHAMPTENTMAPERGPAAPSAGTALQEMGEGEGGDTPPQTPQSTPDKPAMAALGETTPNPSFADPALDQKLDEQLASASDERDDNASTQVAEPAQPQPTAQPMPSPSSSPVNDVMPVVDALNTRINVLETQLGALQHTSGAGDDQARVAMQAAGELAQTLNTLKDQVSALSARLDALEAAPKTMANPTATAQAVVLAASQVQVRAATDAPFVTELDALDQVAQTNANIAALSTALSPYAQGGTPTLAQLRERFGAVATAVMRAAGRTGGGDWLGEVRDALGSLVTVRRTDPATIEDPVERALAVAERALQDDDLATAVAALDGLIGPAAAASAPWLNAAQARLSVNGALKSLQASALEALSGVTQRGGTGE